MLLVGGDVAFFSLSCYSRSDIRLRQGPAEDNPYDYSYANGAHLATKIDYCEMRL